MILLIDIVNLYVNLFYFNLLINDGIKLIKSFE